MKLTEQYIETLNEVLAKTNVIVLPEGGSNNSDWGAGKIATVMSLYNKLIGP